MVSYARGNVMRQCIRNWISFATNNPKEEEIQRTNTAVKVYHAKVGLPLTKEQLLFDKKLRNNATFAENYIAMW